MSTETRISVGPKVIDRAEVNLRKLTQLLTECGVTLVIAREQGRYLIVAEHGGDSLRNSDPIAF